MATKRLKVKRKELDHLSCTFKIYPYPHSILEAVMRYKGKASVGSFPLCVFRVMDEATFTKWVQPYLHRMFMQLKEATDE